MYIIRSRRTSARLNVVAGFTIFSFYKMPRFGI